MHAQGCSACPVQFWIRTLRHLEKDLEILRVKSSLSLWATVSVLSHAYCEPFFYIYTIGISLVAICSCYFLSFHCRTSLFSASMLLESHHKLVSCLSSPPHSSFPLECLASLISLASDFSTAKFSSGGEKIADSKLPSSTPPPPFFIIECLFLKDAKFPIFCLPLIKITQEMEKCTRQVFLGNLQRQMKLIQIHAA